MSTYFIMGALYLGTGLYLKSVEKRRHVRRKNIAGEEEFKSHRDSKMQSAIDCVISIASIFLVIGGVTSLMCWFMIIFHIFYK